MRGAMRGTMRPFKISDLIWLEPLARRYGEWEGLLRSLDRKFIAMVEEPVALAAIYRDDHGMAIAGLAGAEGMKPLIRMCRAAVKQATDTGVPLHGHWAEGTWQARLAGQLNVTNLKG